MSLDICWPVARDILRYGGRVGEFYHSIILLVSTVNSVV